MRCLPLLLLCLVGMASQAETLEEEQASLKQRIATERAALEALKQSREGMLIVLDAIERIARESSARVQSLELEVRRLSARIQKAERLEEMAESAVRAQRERLAIRLFALYRMKRRHQLGFLLSASDFASMVRRVNALRTLVRNDLELLRDLRAAERFQSMARRQLELWRRSAELKLKLLRTERALAASRRATFEEVLSALTAHSSRSGRVLKELEHADRQLQAMIAEMNATAVTGFRALKGRLVWPAKGLLEVGFGKVVNPKFNTVTLRKGIDVRAPMGSPVVAVADAKVAWTGWLKGYGNLVILDHGNGYHSLAAHLSEISVKVGEKLPQGARIGSVGDTGSLKGAYLYFEIRHRGVAIDPVPWLSPEE